MSYQTGYNPASVYNSTVDSRVAFIRKTYVHLAGAITAFVALSCALYVSGVDEAIFGALGASRYSWLLVLGAFSIVGYGATALARSPRGVGTQYLGLGLYTIAEALIFAPFLFIAARFYPGVLAPAAIITLTTFMGLTGYVLIYNKDFSMFRGALVACSFAALGLIVVSVLFGFQLGTWFSLVMILFAVGAILYSTSNVLKYYGEDQYVAAALDLFAAVALLFWYVLRLLMALQRR